MKYEFSFVDLWPYLIIALIFTACYLKKSENTSKIIYITLFAFCALRFDVGWDYTSYVDQIKKGYTGDIDNRIELFSKYVFSIGSYLKFYPIVFIIFAFLTLKITSLAINKYSVNPLLSWLVFYSMPLFFFASLSTLRQSVATAIIFYSYRYATEKKYLLFFITILIACLFHISAIAGVLILPLILVPIGKKGNMLLFFSSFFIAKLLFIILNNMVLGFNFYSRILFYINNETYKSTILQYLYFSIGILNFFFYNRLIKADTRNKELITMSNFGLVLFNILSFEPVSAGRISAFYLIFWVFLIPYYAHFFTPRSAKYVNHIIFIGFVALSFFYLSIYITSYNNGILSKVSFLPYKFWFFHL